MTADSASSAVAEREEDLQLRRWSLRRLRFFRPGAAPHAERWAMVVAFLVGLLALLSPVETHNSDGALGLLAAQSLIDHRTLALDPYRGREELSYDLDLDYRVRRRRGGASFYYSYGVPVVTAPLVWVLNRAGLHMLDREDEDRAQNLISALLCALVFLVLFALCRRLVGAGAGLTISALSTFGSSLLSTLATGMWNSGFSVLFLALATLLLLALDRTREQLSPLDLGLGYGGVFGLFAIAFVCRPAAGFFLVGAVLYALARRLKVGVALALLLGVVAISAGILVSAHQPWLLSYYSPRRLVFTEASPLTGLAGALLSPSRGLFVFSPFLIVVAAVAGVRLRRLAREPLFWLAAGWIVSQIVGVATREVWWGGHSYGPRLLTELMIPFVLLTALAWRGVWSGEGRVGRWAAALYLALALPAVLIHAGQGLFNHQVLWWNRLPDVDRYPHYVFDWRYPQFLATGSSIGRRWFELETAALEPLPFGERLGPDDARAAYLDWHPPEPEWRWSSGRESALGFRLPTIDPERLYLLELDATTLEPQPVRLELNGRYIGALELGSLDHRQRLLAVPGRRLRHPEGNTLELEVPDPATPAGDERRLGVALRSLAWRELEIPLAGVSYDDEPFFGRGWSEAEAGWRWSRERLASLVYPLLEVDPADRFVLRLEAGTLGPQPVAVRLNGKALGLLELPGEAPVRSELQVPASRLRSFRLNRIEILLEEARELPDDPRRLGLRFVSLYLGPA